MSFWQHVWARLKSVPLGVWAALTIGLSILGLYLRGRRLEAELGKAKLAVYASEAKASAANNTGRADAHLQAADAHAERARDLEKTLDTISEASAKEHKRLVALPPEQITAEYLKLAERKKELN